MGGLHTVRVSGSLCAYCGSVGRLIVETELEVIDRCYVCGDEAVRRRGGLLERSARPSDLVTSAASPPAR